jgi:antirestriction protein ArdC
MARSTEPTAWSAILIEAVSKPGIISEAYRRFWNYSTGNQLLALIECAVRGIEPGPINTFRKWKELGRHVNKGEYGIALCMPVTIKRKTKQSDQSEADEPGKFTKFIFRANWFVLAQTEGNPYVPQELPEWSEDRALAALSIARVPFDHPNGNTQGFARERSVSISPIAFLPHRTLFHELAHVVLGHTTVEALSDDEHTPKNLREVEAECVALICAESLGLAGAEYSRGYIQHWLGTDTISERSAQRIFKAADEILKAGHPSSPMPT